MQSSAQTFGDIQVRAQRTELRLNVANAAAQIADIVLASAHSVLQDLQVCESFQEGTLCVSESIFFYFSRVIFSKVQYQRSNPEKLPTYSHTLRQ